LFFRVFDLVWRSSSSFLKTSTLVRPELCPSEDRQPAQARTPAALAHPLAELANPLQVYPIIGPTACSGTPAASSNNETRLWEREQITASVIQTRAGGRAK